MSFEDNIREWVALDNRIKNSNAELKALRNQRSMLCNDIFDHVTNHNMSHNTIQISDGLLRFQNAKVTPPLTFKFITQCLKECIVDEEQVAKLIQYIKEKREVRYVPEVKRTYKSV
tara:strand:+ start:452 stop:799 length:348 start_codon:yes stop_codon:yes gene_type:complete